MKSPNSTGGYAVSYPFRISLESLALKEMATCEYDQETTGDHLSQDYSKNLRIWETERRNNGFHTVNEYRIDLDIEQNGNTYTTTIALPEWFDVSIYNDLTDVNVHLFRTNFYSVLYQNGSAMADAWYSFNP